MFWIGQMLMLKGHTFWCGIKKNGIYKSSRPECGIDDPGKWRFLSIQGVFFSSYTPKFFLKLMVYRGWEKLQVCPVWDLKWETCSWPEATMTPTPQQVAKNTRNVALKINQQACSWRGFFDGHFPREEFYTEARLKSVLQTCWWAWSRLGVFSCSSILRCLLDEHALACGSLSLLSVCEALCLVLSTARKTTKRA